MFNNYSILTLLGGLTKHAYYVFNHVLDSQLELVDNDTMAPYVLGSNFPIAFHIVGDGSIKSWMTILQY